MTPEYIKFNNWLMIELVIFGATISGNIVFLLTRSIASQKIVIGVKRMIHGETTDFLESRSIILGIYIQMHAPMVMLYFIKHEMSDSKVADPTSELVTTSFYRALFQAAACLYLTFVSFINPPFQFLSSFWLDIGPLIHGFLTIAAFVVIPCFEIWYRAKFEDNQFACELKLVWTANFILLVFWVPSQLAGVFIQAIARVRELKRIRSFTKYRTWDQLLKASQVNRLVSDVQK